MFETEAGFAETKMLIKCNGDYSKKQDYKKGFQDGAEFGYNKCFEQIRKIVNEDTRLDCIIPELLRLKERE